MRETIHTKTMFSHMSKLANSQFVLGCIASDITVHEGNLHLVKSHQIFQIQFTMKSGHRPTICLDNTVSAKVIWVNQHFDEADYTGIY